jgi:hypothetical protein
LNEEVRQASGLSLAAYSATSEADAPRYGEQANIEHHPQVSDFVPRRKRAVLLLLTAGLATAAAAEALSHFAERIAAVVPGVSATELANRIAGGAVAWASAISLLMIAMLAKLIHSLRRHRVDDYRGRYRVWRWVAWGAMFGSVNAVVQIQPLVGKLAVTLTGMSLTTHGSEWWLAPAALVGGWIGIRLLLEIAESRSALAVMLLAIASYGVAAAGVLGWSPAILGSWSEALTSVLPLAGHTIALTSLLLFGRYVVLDVQGLIEHKPRPAAPVAKKKEVEPASKPAGSLPAASAASALKAVTHAQPRDDSSWSDDDSDEEHGPTRKLSKAERKRLRKQNRAA